MRVTEAQADEEFEKMSEEDMKFQDDVLVGPCVWPHAKETAASAKAMLETLGYGDDNIEILENQTKAQYIEKLDALKQKAMDFEDSNPTGKVTLALMIINIGNRIDPFAAPHKPLLAALGVEPTGKNIGDYDDFYELTKDGDVLNLNEYAAYIADTRETKVQ